MADTEAWPGRRSAAAAVASAGAPVAGAGPGEAVEERLAHLGATAVGKTPGTGSTEAVVGDPGGQIHHQEVGEQPQPTPPPDTLRRLLPAVGALLGSTTVLTGLLFYFGRMHITGFFRYLRVNYTTLELTLYDHLVRSADGLFVPLTAVAVGGVAAIAGHRVLGGLTTDARQRSLRVLTPVAAALGVVLVAVALLDLFSEGPLFRGRPWVGGVVLCLGVLLLAYATHLARDGRPVSTARPSAPSGSSLDLAALAQGAFAFLLISVGVFWAAGNYAIAVGTGRAQQLVAELPTSADAVLYSERSLRLALAGVTEVRCLDPEAAYRFRYDGLKLVLQSGDQYLLLPAGWTRENGTAVLVPRSDAVRLEFAPPGQQRQASC